MEKKTMNANNMSIVTASGKTLDLEVPLISDIDAYDIARGLAHKGHFAGQTDKMFTIAEHCLLVAHIIEYGEVPKQHEKTLILLALLHDAAEAYINDMLSPIKKYSSVYKTFEFNIQVVIHAKYGVGDVDNSLFHIIKSADNEAKQVEFDHFYNDIKSELLMFYEPDEAFNRYYYRLIRAIMEYKEEQYER